MNLYVSGSRRKRFCFVLLALLACLIGICVHDETVCKNAFQRRILDSSK